MNMADNMKSSLAIGATVLALSGAPQSTEAGGFAELVASGGPQVQAVLDGTHSKTVNLKDGITLAQATETDGKTYTVYVIQIDGSKKAVKYTKDANGIINPPAMSPDEKFLLDGSPATSNPKLNIGKNRMILAKYDKDTQTYASLDIKIVVNEADAYIKKIITLAQDGKDISRDDLFNAYYGVYIFQRLGTNPEKQLNGLDIIATKRVKIDAQELSSIKIKAEAKAKTIIPVVTNAVG